ncbi:MAG: VOC family protein [Zoogloea sp.]|nr:VOC family protein [Zoogloea sp.]
MKPNPVGWFEIYVEDMDRAKKFYETVFQTKLEDLHSPDVEEMWAFPMEPNLWGAGGSLVRMAGRTAGGNSTLVYFSCDDCAVEESRAEKAGGRIQRTKMSIGQYGFISLVVDSEGNMIGLHSMK